MRSSFGKLSALTWGGAALSLVLSCSGREQDSTGVSAAVDFCQRWLDAAVTISARCLGASAPAIRALIDQTNPCLDVSASLSTAHLKYDARFADACLTDTQAITCSQESSASTACSKVFVGEVPVGGSCLPLAFSDLSECVAGNQCSMASLCPGSCVPLAKAGDACGGASGILCDAGLSCHGVPSVCAPGSAQGDGCSINQPCSGDLICEGSSGPTDHASDPSAQAGTCQPKPNTGPCDFDSDCSNRCAHPSPPDSTGHGHCAAYKPVGEPCTPAAEECTIGAYCGVDARCVSWPSLGQSCAGNAGEGSECLDSYCDPTSVTCVAFLHAGDPCTLSFSAGFPPDPCGGFRLVCDSGHCSPGCLSAEQ